MNRIWMIVLLLMLPVWVSADGGIWSWATSFKRMKGVEAVTDSTYKEECGECHMAYQPGLLPEGSWQKIMAASALEDHFGENAELDEDARLYVLNVLIAASADKSMYKRSRKITRSLVNARDKTPLRIIDVPYIKSKHDEVPKKLIEQEAVKSLSQCDVCHQRADEGSFDDDTVKIPGHGYWDD